MKIISWNCNGGFRNKFQALEKFNADIWIIQESESPDYLKEKNIFIPANNHLWCGDKAFKGMSIFSFHGFTLRMADFFSPEFKYVLPTVVSSPRGEECSVTGIWASKVKGNPDWDYIGQMCVFMERYSRFFTPSMIMIGDFNSNMQWNHYHKKEHNYARFLELMSELEMFSAYHEINHIKQGHESLPTSYYHRDAARGFHIDYAFMGRQNISTLKNFSIEGKEWLKFSDHMPLVLETENE